MLWKSGRQIFSIRWISACFWKLCVSWFISTSGHYFLWVCCLRSSCYPSTKVSQLLLSTCRKYAKNWGYYAPWDDGQAQCNWVSALYVFSLFFWLWIWLAGWSCPHIWVWFRRNLQTVWLCRRDTSWATSSSSSSVDISIGRYWWSVIFPLFRDSPAINRSHSALSESLSTSLSIYVEERIDSRE